MLQKLTIKNFRSLQKVTVDLQRVNLLIGPNNSGKSNFLKVFEFLYDFYSSGQLTQKSFSRNYTGFLDPINFISKGDPISFYFSFKFDDKKYGIYLLEIFGTTESSWPIYRELFGMVRKELSDLQFDDLMLHLKNFYFFNLNVINNAPIDKICHDFETTVPTEQEFILTLNDARSLDIQRTKKTGLDFIKLHNNYSHTHLLLNIFEKIVIHQPDINKLRSPGILGTEKYLKKDVSNLISFLDNLRDSNPELLERIEKDLHECINDFERIRFDKIEINKTIYKQIGMSDNRGKIYWADELSEGTLYFLAILSIIHQPQPPNLLLLEEPEKGIHPRRIHEIMEYIFRFANEKNIQIILTTHSTQLVSEFDDNTESVFIFEIQNGVTIVKNLLNDIIIPSDERSDKEGFPKINYKEILGERWYHGFLGGVPG